MRYVFVWYHIPQKERDGEPCRIFELFGSFHARCPQRQQKQHKKKTVGEIGWLDIGNLINKGSLNKDLLPFLPWNLRCWF